MSEWSLEDEYDLRARERAQQQRIGEVIDKAKVLDVPHKVPNELTSTLRVDILPGAFAVIDLNEEIELPPWIGGIMGLRKVYGQKKLMMGSTIIETGYCGKVQLQIMNLSDCIVEIKQGDALVNVLYVQSISK